MVVNGSGIESKLKKESLLSWVLLCFIVQKSMGGNPLLASSEKTANNVLGLEDTHISFSSVFSTNRRFDTCQVDKSPTGVRQSPAWIFVLSLPSMAKYSCNFLPKTSKHHELLLLGHVSHFLTPILVWFGSVRFFKYQMEIPFHLLNIRITSFSLSECMNAFLILVSRVLTGIWCLFLLNYRIPFISRWYRNWNLHLLVYNELFI